MRPVFFIQALLLSFALFGSAFAQEAAIRKALTERYGAQLKIDEITKSPIAGLYEVRYGGTEILYSDEKGEFIFISGAMVDTKTRTNLTQARIDKLLAIDFDKLPLKDAMVIRQGNGTRRMAVFVDPNCGYCKQFERDLAALKDLTIYTFLIPILSVDSVAKSHDIWCSKEPVQAWRAWMLDNVTPPKSPKCDAAAIDRNLAFAQQQHINGTPALFFADGSRKPGALPGEQVERLLQGGGAKAAAK